MRVFKYFASAFLGLFLAVAMTHLHASAAEGVDLTTSPLPISLSVLPGNSVSTDVRVKNESSTTQQLKVSLMKFTAYGESGKPALKDREPGDDYFDWVSFSPASITAPPGQWETVKMTISTPKTAAFGYYYAVVFTPQTTKPTGKGNVLLGSTAVLVLLDVQNPGAKRSVKIISFEANRRTYEFLPVNFNIKLHNDGNVHVVPHGDIFIKRGSKQVASLSFNSGQGNILPGTNRIYTATWSDGFPVPIQKLQGSGVVLDKNGQPETQLKWDFSKFSKLRFGHYTAQLLAVYDNGRQDVPLEASVSFWVIPWRLILLIVAVPVLPSLLVYLIMKRRFKNQLKKGKSHAKK